MAGLTSTGFVAKTLAECKAEIEQELRDAFGASIDLSPTEPWGQFAGIMAEREAELWDLAQAVHVAFDPSAAIGVSLDAVSALTGTVREPATFSEVTGTATGTPGTPLTAGRVASVSGTGTRFASTADATIVAVTAWSAYTAVLGDRRTNGGNVYQCSTAGTSVTGPSGTGTGIADGGTARWDYLGAGTGAVDVEFQAEEEGPKVATARTLTVIESAVGGWQNVINVLDAALGVEDETDTALRSRREDEVRAIGTSPVEAIRSNLLLVEDVSSVTVFENITSVTDADGLPPKSVEALVLGGDADDIRQAIFDNKAGGIEPHGSTSGTVTDSQGVSHTVKFTRPTEVDIWVTANVTVNAELFPSDGSTRVRDAILAFANAQKPGKDVVASSLEAQCFSVAGMLDAECLIRTSSPPIARTTIAMTLRQLAKFDSSRITVNVTPGTP